VTRTTSISLAHTCDHTIKLPKSLHWGSAVPLFNAAAIALWTATGDEDHIYIVGSYFHYSVPGGFHEPQAKDISPRGGLFGKSDPMYVVFAEKKA
jgi:hypothetical protein